MHLRNTTLWRGLRWAGLVLAAGALASGCKSAKDTTRVTGTQGGMLPGMKRPAPAPGPASKPNPAMMVQTADQVLPDGRVRRVQSRGGLVLAETFFSRNGVRETEVLYEPTGWPQIQTEFASNGARERTGVFYPGTTQLQRMEDYDGNGNVASFTTFWPDGHQRIHSEVAQSNSYGTVTRVQEWYADGRPKSLVQRVNTRDTHGSPVTWLQGRQSEWDASGRATYDAEYDHGKLTVDYLNPLAPEEAAGKPPGP